MDPISDEDIRKTVWDGHIPTLIRLHKDDIASTQTPDDLYILLPRVSFLHLWTEPIKEHFRSYTVAIGDEMWFDCAKVPLKAHYPIGVLFDLHCGSFQLPWKITVHFQGHPSDLIRFKSVDDVKDFYTNTIKESDYLKHGSTKRIMSLPIEEHNQLWESFRYMRFVEYWRINDAVFTDRINPDVKFIPMRIYIKGRPFIQEPISPIDTTGREKSLRRALAEIFPSYFATEEEVITEFGAMESLSLGTAVVEPTVLEARVAGGNNSNDSPVHNEGATFARSLAMNMPSTSFASSMPTSSLLSGNLSGAIGAMSSPRLVPSATPFSALSTPSIANSIQSTGKLSPGEDPDGDHDSNSSSSRSAKSQATTHKRTTSSSATASVSASASASSSTSTAITTANINTQGNPSGTSTTSASSPSSATNTTNSTASTSPSTAQPAASTITSSLSVSSTNSQISASVATSTASATTSPSTNIVTQSINTITSQSLAMQATSPTPASTTQQNPSMMAQSLSSSFTGAAEDLRKAAQANAASTTQRTAQGTIRKIQAQNPTTTPLTFQPLVVIQGIQVDLESPLRWLSEQASHPDNFLHVCLVDPKQWLP
eukprot:TRINITY_DN6472_c0_g2_i1.p1 TRINITY_DN6472_c0_g2~~TRINITY_DN6472_c0_g2_i1.p1  ORF type:complete len:599 (-),score=137.80 TRINITY_DN6472_c0_g2_i1:215-2011(-)